MIRFVLSLIFLGAAFYAPAQTVAEVNGDLITMDELTKELLIRHGGSVLEDLIRSRAIEQEMAKANVTVSTEEVDNEIARQRMAFRQRVGESRTFEQIVNEQYNMSLDGYRQIVHRWLLLRRFILRQEQVSDDEVLLWFYRNRERYDVPVDIRLRHVFIAKEDPATGAERPEIWIRGRIAEVRRALASNKAFDEVARRFSDDPLTRDIGGDLGSVNERAARMHLDPAFVEAMLALSPGQSGGPVETAKGHHFINVISRNEGRKVEFAEVRAQVRLDYMEERAMVKRDLVLRQIMEKASINRYFEPPAR